MIGSRGDGESLSSEAACDSHDREEQDIMRLSTAEVVSARLPQDQFSTSGRQNGLRVTPSGAV